MSTFCDLTHKQAEGSLASCRNGPQELYWPVLQHAVQCNVFGTRVCHTVHMNSCQKPVSSEL